MQKSNNKVYNRNSIRQLYRGVDPLDKSGKYDVITLGSATLDVFCNTDAELVTIQDSKSKRELIAYPVGSKILIKDLKFLVGGGGTNTAVSFSRLGLDVAYLGTLGDDDNSGTVMDLLCDENIEFIGNCKKGMMTGYSVILDSVEDDRTILTFKGSNDSFRFSDFNKKKINSEWLYMCAMTGSAFDELEKAARFAKERRIKVAFNPSSYIAKLGIAKLKMLKYVDALIINKEELNMILGKEESSEVTTEKLKAISSHGPSIIVITDGPGEINAYDRKHHYRLMPGKVKVVETTGAGDAFASAFITGLIWKKSIEESLIIGLINSQSIVTHFGAKTGLLSRKEMLRKLKGCKLKVRKTSV